MNFFDRVKLEVKNKNTTIEVFLEKVFSGSVTRDVYNGWRRRNLLPRADDAVKIAKGLGVSVEYLVTGATPKEDYLSIQLQSNNDLRALTETALKLPENRINDLRHIAETWLPTSNGTKERLA